MDNTGHRPTAALYVLDKTTGLLIWLGAERIMRHSAVLPKKDGFQPSVQYLPTEFGSGGSVRCLSEGAASRLRGCDSFAAQTDIFSIAWRREWLHSDIAARNHEKSQ